MNHHPGSGFFAAGLEYSTGCKSVVVGKPEKKFFQSALDEINAEHGTDIRIEGSINMIWIFFNISNLCSTVVVRNPL